MRFGKVVQKIESYSMDPVFQNFRRSFGPPTPFFQSLSLDPLTTMEELYGWDDRSLMLEDNICATTKTVMITNQLTEGNEPSWKKPYDSKDGQTRDRKRCRD